jgi:hypothetical protein
MATCPSGHESASDDFCDVCGVLIGAAPTLGAGQAAAGATEYGATVVGPVAGGPAPAEDCPRCGIARAGQFCESCGYDFALAAQNTLGPGAYPAPPPGPPPGPAPPPAPPAAGPATQVPPSAPSRPAAAVEWTAVVTADRAYFDAIQAADGPDAGGITFPVYCPQRRFRLAGTEVRIGRRSASSGIDPEIDLSVPPVDPGVSRLHAVLLKAPDGTWSVVDPGSANGTAVNGSEIPHGRAVPLREGDRIHLGAWTELRVVRGA